MNTNVKLNTTKSLPYTCLLGFIFALRMAFWVAVVICAFILIERPQDVVMGFK
jgi:hypothetical protein